MDFKIKKYLNFYVLLGYLVLTLIMTYPMILKMDHYIPGDTFGFIWSFWWIKHALFDFHTNPLYTYYLFYPIGMDLSMYVLTPFNSIVSLPFQLLFNEIVAFNVMFLFSFIASGFGMFLLVKYLTKNVRAAFISGVIFAFCPFRFAHAMGHLHVISVEWYPFFILFLIKTFREKNIKNPILAGVFLSLASLCDWHHLLFLSMFSFVFLLYQTKINWKSVFNKNLLYRSLMGLLVFFLIMAPLLLPLVKQAITNPRLKRPLDPSIITSADLFAFVTPAEFHPIFGKYVSKIYELFTGNVQEHTVFLGYTVIILSVYASLKLSRKKTRFWLISAIIFFILALGPVLHVFGRFLFPSPFNLGDIVNSIGLETSQLGYDLLSRFIGIPLPYLVLHLYFPFFNLLRTPARFTILVMLSLSVLSGFAVSNLLNKNKKKKNFIFLILLLLILFEFLAIPLQLLEFNAPDFYKKLAEDEEDYAIIDVPISHRAEYLSYQIIHNKKLVEGTWSRRPPNTTYFIENTPLLYQLQDPISSSKKAHDKLINKVINANPEATDIIEKYLKSEEDVYSYSEVKNVSTKEPSKDDIKKLQSYDIRYIIIHKNLLEPKDFENMNDLVRSLLTNKKPFYEDEDLVVYNIGS